ncbi:hypothetical protein TB2_014322 [Malus domestica]
MASWAAAKVHPKNAPKEGTEVSAPVHTASLCKCSSFSAALALMEKPPLVCFFPVSSSLSDMLLVDANEMFGAL